MTSIFQSIYDRLPIPLKQLAVSGRGYYLRRLRYGTETESLVHETLARDVWSREQWKNWQDKKLSRMLHHAAMNVCYYQNRWRLRRQNGDQSSWEDLRQWPVLNKAAVRSNPGAFIADGADPKYLYRDQTSGTTGTPLAICCNRSTIREWYAIFEARARRWHGVSFQDKWAIFGGKLIVPFGQNQPPYWIYNAGMRQLYMSSYHLSRQTAKDYVEALWKYRPTHVIAYPSAVAVLGAAIIEFMLELPPLKAIICNAEMLLPSQRQTLAAAFDCPVIDTYGMCEIAAAASECEQGTLHAWPDVGIIEVLDENDQPVPEGTSGRLVLTGLLNSVMPLIRYEVGDRGALADADGATCPCGRFLPIMRSLDGRNDDQIITRDGRKIGRLDPVFKGDYPIQEAQIIQESHNVIRLKYVPLKHFTSNHAEQLKDALRDRIGGMEIVLESVAAIPRGANGKFKAVISHIHSP